MLVLSCRVGSRATVYFSLVIPTNKLRLEVAISRSAASSVLRSLLFLITVLRKN